MRRDCRRRVCRRYAAPQLAAATRHELPMRRAATMPRAPLPIRCMQGAAPADAPSRCCAAAADFAAERQPAADTVPLAAARSRRSRHSMMRMLAELRHAVDDMRRAAPQPPAKQPQQSLRCRCRGWPCAAACAHVCLSAATRCAAAMRRYAADTAASHAAIRHAFDLAAAARRCRSRRAVILRRRRGRRQPPAPPLLQMPRRAAAATPQPPAAADYGRLMPYRDARPPHASRCAAAKHLRDTAAAASLRRRFTQPLYATRAADLMPRRNSTLRAAATFADDAEAAAALVPAARNARRLPILRRRRRHAAAPAARPPPPDDAQRQPLYAAKMPRRGRRQMFACRAA